MGISKEEQTKERKKKNNKPDQMKPWKIVHKNLH